MMSIDFIVTQLKEKLASPKIIILIKKYVV